MHRLSSRLCTVALVLLLTVPAAGQGKLAMLGVESDATGLWQQAGPLTTEPPPATGDVCLSVSEATLTSVFDFAINSTPRPRCATEHALESLTISLAEDSYLALAGRMHVPPNSLTREAIVDFSLRARVDTARASVLRFRIVEARILLDGVEAFVSKQGAPSGLGAWLDLLSPGLARIASGAAAGAESALSRDLGQTPPISSVPLVRIQRGTIEIDVLPTLLAPLVDAIEVTSFAIAGRHIVITGGLK